ncbi:MAG: hypothetical protein M3O02_11030, partial [Acidobacteriota bacterium]|nr:hypothetical protein [Acidobacteriota bacterium]
AGRSAVRESAAGGGAHVAKESGVRRLPGMRRRAGVGVGMRGGLEDASGWMVMTSTTTWTGDGARVVMTSVRGSAGPGAARRMAEAVRSDFGGPAEAPSGAAGQPQSQQSFPYAAAVPVRGGWLIVPL